ncbi:hypothetical protein [Dysgonomonas reticulitermitis]
MKTTICLFILILLCFSCKKITDKEETTLFSDKEKEECISILKAYQNCDSATFDIAKETAIEISKMRDSTDTQSTELYMNKNVINIDSVTKIGIEYIKENRYRELMSLLDENKIDFYAHPNNNVFIMGDFNALLALLYYRYLPKEEIIEKEIEMSIFRKILCWGIIGIREIRGQDSEEYEEYVQIYKEELVSLVKLYRAKGDKEKAMQYSDELLEIIGKTIEDKRNKNIRQI